MVEGEGDTRTAVPPEVEETVTAVIDAAYHLHRGLGPGLLESVYEAVLARLLEERGLFVERQRVVPLEFHGLRFEEAYRADLLIEGSLVLELKSVERLAPVHPKQLLTYLRLLDMRVGLLINFGAPTFKAGIKRVVNPKRATLPSASSRLRVTPALPGSPADP